MKKFKQAAAFIMAASMVVASLAGCGDKSAETSAETTAETAGESGSTSAAGGVFKIGGIGPTTGGAAVYGQAVKNAMELAAEEINAAGGINGAQVEIQFEDDEHDPEKAVNAYNSLKDHSCFAQNLSPTRVTLNIYSLPKMCNLMVLEFTHG